MPGLLREVPYTLHCMQYRFLPPTLHKRMRFLFENLSDLRGFR